MIEFFDFPFELGLIIYLALFSLVMSLLTLLFMLGNRIRRTLRRLRGDSRGKRLSIRQNSFRFITVIIWLLLSTSILFLAAFVQSYKSFTRKVLVAEVQCMPLGDGTQQSMHLEFTPVRAGEKLAPETFLITGDQWAVEGNILKWDNWLNFAGLHTMYKITRVRGRYLKVEEERSRTPSVFSLVEDEENPRWRWLYETGHRLRFVDAVYGNTVFTYPSAENVFEIYVTTSGFIAKVREGN